MLKSQNMQPYLGMGRASFRVIDAHPNKWTYRRKVRGLNISQGQLYYCTSVHRLRAYIPVRGVMATHLMEFSRRDLVAIRLDNSGREKGGDSGGISLYALRLPLNHHHRRKSQDL